MNQLEDFRQQIDDFMKHHPQSPLEHELRHNFAGLAYYQENEDLILDVMVEQFADDEPIVTMQTSTGDTQQYRRWGHFSFEIEGKEATLTIYSDPRGHEFFMPFRDSTNGDETYGAGRYLDNHRPGMQKFGTNRFEIDLNYAYNPYCAYSSVYSCPLPPRENWLSVPIRAGEKDYKPK
jgi:uncharacterized protein (DUF1684 family)